MEFWGVEVPSGKPLTCQPGSDSYVHISQAALGDNKNAKGNDRVVLKVKVGTNEVVVGTLSQGKCDQATLDLIFEKDFVLSHNGSGSVYFCGYKTDAVSDAVRDYESSSDEEDDEFDNEDEEEANPAKENGKVGLKAGKAPATKPAAKPLALKSETPAGNTKLKTKTPIAEKSKDAKAKSTEDYEDDDDDDEDDEDEEDDSDEDDDMLEASSDDEDLGSDEEDESDSELESDEEEQTKSAGKKRPAPTLQAASAGKKGKTETPGGKAEPKTPSAPALTPKQQQQQSGKKDASAKKTPGKENSNTPASGKKLGQFFCQPCNKNFNSESALSQHKTAKHK